MCCLLVVRRQGFGFVDFALPFDCGFIVGFGFIAQYVVFELGASCVVWFVLAVCLVFVLYLRWLFVAVRVFLP